MSEAELEAIRCPVLICQAESNPGCPMLYAEKLAEDLSNVPGGAILYKVKASTGLITVFNASIVNKVFSAFLSRLPAARSDRAIAAKSLAETMLPGLRRLAEYQKDPSILTKRNLSSPLSFSCVTEEVFRSQEEVYRAFAKGQRQAFSPLSASGRPIRKYSERKDDWSMPVDSSGYSYAGHKTDHRDTNVSFDINEVKNSIFDFVGSEPMSPDDQVLARSRRMMMGIDFTSLQHAPQRQGVV